MGKIQVVNVLFASLFNHKLTVLHILPQKYINNMIKNFIWSGRKPKIALNLLQDRKDDSGGGVRTDRHCQEGYNGKMDRIEFIKIPS